MIYKQIIVIITSILLWHISQFFLSTDVGTNDKIIDRLHDSVLFSTINNYLHQNLLIVEYNFILTSFLIDINVLYMAWRFIITRNIKPAAILLVGITIRQLCQYINRLPVPSSVIWFDPSFPTIFVTYHVTNDFFFSGHTYISLCSGIEIMKNSSIMTKLYGALFIIYEILFIISIHAHYFMDIYGAFATYFMLNYFYDYFNNE